MHFTETEIMEVATTTQTMNGNEKGQAWYDQVLEDYDYESPRRGQILEGEVLRIDEDALVVDVGLKRDAIVPNWDLSKVNNEVLKGLSVGDKILVYVLRPPVGDDDLMVSFNKGIEHENWEKAEHYLENGELLDLQVVGKNRGGFLLAYETLRGFLPYSQVPELHRIHNHQRAEEIKREMIGDSILVKVIEVNRNRQRLIFSAHAARQERRQQRLQELEVGQIIHGPIVNIVKFGVFVDLDGVDGLVHISKLDWKRVDHPADLFKLGEEIDVKVIHVDIERERVSLDRKSLLPSPWESVTEQFKPGETIEGLVTKVLDFGAFIEVTEGIEGLVHSSEIGYSTTGKPQDVVKPGEKVLVRVLDIDKERQRMSLSMRQVPLESQIAWSLENAQVDSKETVETAEMKESGESTATIEADKSSQTAESGEVTNLSEVEESSHAAGSDESTAVSQTVETGESTKISQAEESSQAAGSGESTATIETDESSQTVESSEATNLSEVEESSQAAGSDESTAPSQAEESSQTAETGEATNLSEVEESSQASGSDELTAASQSEESSQTAETGEPVESQETAMNQAPNPDAVD